MTGEGLLVLIAILAAVQAFRQAPNVEGEFARRSSSSPASWSLWRC